MGELITSGSTETLAETSSNSMSVIVVDALVIAVVMAIAWTLQRLVAKAMRSGTLGHMFGEVSLFANGLQLSMQNKYSDANLMLGTPSSACCENRVN